jgi:DNA invertase Pin-like site-specific DNA recombinase
MRLAAIYARVSTDRQESQQTVDSQLDALRRAAEEGGYELLDEYVFVDENYSGSRLDRPGLERLRDLASEGAFEAVFIYSPDRLARQYANPRWWLLRSCRRSAARSFSSTTPSVRAPRSRCSCRYRECSPSTSGH